MRAGRGALHFLYCGTALFLVQSNEVGSGQVGR